MPLYSHFPIKPSVMGCNQTVSSLVFEKTSINHKHWRHWQWKAIDLHLCSNWTLIHHFWILDRNLCVLMSVCSSHCSYHLTYNIEQKPYAPLFGCFLSLKILIFRWESSFLELTVALILNHLHWFEAVVYFQYYRGVWHKRWLFPVHLFPSAVWGLTMSHPFVCAATDFWSHALFILIWLLSTKRERTQPPVWETGMEGDAERFHAEDVN